MRVICNRSALLDAMVVVNKVVAQRSLKPVLTCVKLVADKDTLLMSATDLEVSIQFANTQVQVERTGEVLIPAETLLDIVRESADDTLCIDVDAEGAKITGGDSAFKVFTQKVEDFPALGADDAGKFITLDGATVKRLIECTKFCTAKEAHRYAYNGALWSVKGKDVKCVATDGRRLAVAIAELSEKCEKPIAAILPIKALVLIESLLEDPEEKITLSFSENRVVVKAGSATMASNLLDGTFPPFEDVVPKDADKKMAVATGILVNAVRRAALLTTEDSRSVRFAFGKNGLVLSARSAESGEATVNLPCKYEGADVEIGFNASFLIEGLRAVSEDEITLEMSAPNRPGLLRAGANFLYVIMPVNLE